MYKYVLNFDTIFVTVIPVYDIVVWSEGCDCCKRPHVFSGAAGTKVSGKLDSSGCGSGPAFRGKLSKQATAVVSILFYREKVAIASLFRYHG